MPDMLLEIFGEQMPASVLGNKSYEIHQMLIKNLSKESITFSSSESFYTPTRLAHCFYKLNISFDKTNNSIKGPALSAPKAAVNGFARSFKVTVDQLDIENTKKGKYYFYVQKQKKISIEKKLTSILEKTLGEISWKKAMKWGEHSNIKWVRPLKNILCIFNNRKLSINFLGFQSNNLLFYSNPMIKKSFKIKNIKDYFKYLEVMNVEINQNKRKKLISLEIIKISKKNNLKYIPDEKLLEEVISIVEFPNVFMAEFNSDFLNLPTQILTTTMKSQQKYFPLYDKNNSISNKFIVVANIKPNDKGKKIIEGNQRVINARLNDANFFWKKDLNKSFLANKNKLDKVIFHHRLGTLRDKIDRIDLILEYICKISKSKKSEVKTLKTAASLFKNDLVTEVVREFPSLQGTMGYYYAKNDNYQKPVLEAILEQYKPVGPNDKTPTLVTSKILSIVDKLDSLVGFFIIDQAPTSSKDPFALRRASLGIIRNIIDGKMKINLTKLISETIEIYFIKNPKIFEKTRKGEVLKKIIQFILERFENLNKDKSQVYDLVFKSLKIDETNLNLFKIDNNIKELKDFISTQEGNEALRILKRILNILQSEKFNFANCTIKDLNKNYLVSKEEKIVYDLVVKTKIAKNFKDEFVLLIKYIKPIRNFFDKVKVNADDKNIKKNRFILLSLVYNNVGGYINFSRIIKGSENA